MGRTPRSRHQHGLHHVMNRGAGRRLIFLDDRDRVEFGRVLGEACERTGVSVVAYCLMPNHFHLVVDCPDGRLSETMQWLAAVMTRRTNQRWASDGPILRGRFRSKQITTDEYLVAAVRYVHRNPAGLLGGAPLDTYRWSSLRSYLGYRRPPSWLRTDLIVDPLGATATPPIEVSTMLELAEFALDEMVEHAPVGPKLARTVLLLAADRLVGDRSALLDELGYSEPRRAEQAVARARRRAVANPLLVDAACRLADAA